MTAGLTVAVVAVPQSMAYAFIAGVPPQYGLYTVILQSLLNSLFSSQPHISAGPINTQSLLVASTVTRLAGSDPALYLQMVIGLAVIKGLLQIAMAAARLGALVKYISQSVIVGFTAGAGILIACGQINSFLGFSVTRTADDWPGLIGIFQRLIPQIDATNTWSVLLGVAALAIMVVSRRISRLVPGPLIAVAVTACIVGVVGWTTADFGLVGEIPRSFTPPTYPHLTLRQIELLLPGALALSLLGLMEAYSIGKTLAAKSGTTLSANRELFSQGVANFVSGFCWCIPGSGSFSRSALNHAAGAKTSFSGIFNALFVLAIFLMFAPVARLIPMSAIAAILWVIAFGLIDFSYFRKIIRSSPADALVCFGTLGATLFLPLAYAVIVGVFLNLAFYLRLASQLHLAEMVPTAGGVFHERPLDERNVYDRVVFLQIEGDLFFGIADELQKRLAALIKGDVEVVIFRLKRTHSIDSTVLQVLDEFAKRMMAQGGHVILAGLKPELRVTLEQYGLAGRIGSENVFETGVGVFASAKLALRRAQELVGDSLDEEWLRMAGEKINGDEPASTK